jgi:hypothetical protein
MLQITICGYDVILRQFDYECQRRRSISISRLHFGHRKIRNFSPILTFIIQA